MLLPSFGRIHVLVQFKLHQDYIQKELCVEKDKKVNTCKGSCHLSAQLNKVDEKQSKKTPLNISEFLDFPVFQQATETYSIVQIPLNTEAIRKRNEMLPLLKFHTRLLRPPQIT